MGEASDISAWWNRIKWGPYMPTFAHEVRWEDSWKKNEHYRKFFQQLFYAAIAKEPTDG